MRVSVLALALFAALALVLVACENGAAERNKAGLKFLEQERLGQAITEFDAAIELDPEAAVPYYNRGNTYIRLGESKRAIEDFDEAIRLDPRFARAYNGRGYAYAHYATDPKTVKAARERGVLLLSVGQPRRAIEDFNEAIRLDPELALAYSNRGGAYFRLDELQRAIEDFDEAIRLDRKTANAYWGRGRVYHQQGLYRRAVEDYDEAVLLKARGIGVVYRYRALAYAHLGNDRQAVVNANLALLAGEDVASLNKEIETIKKQR